MAEETPNLGEEAPAKPDEGGESEDQKEFDKLFEGIDFDDENADVEELKKKVEDIKKGAAKFFSEKGMKKETPPVEPKPAEKKEDTTDLEVIFFESKPEAELVKDDLKQIAEAKGISLIQAWKQESWVQNKAKALHSEKTETEGNKERIGNPSALVPPEKDAEQKAIEQTFVSNLPSGFSVAKPKL